MKKIILKIYLKFNVPDVDCEDRALGESILEGQLYKIAGECVSCSLFRKISNSRRHFIFENLLYYTNVLHYYTEVKNEGIKRLIKVSYV